MNYELVAKFASIQEDEEALVFGFSDDEFEVTKYVMLQYPLSPEEQNVRLGDDGLYIELDDQRYSCYLGVKEIRRVDDRIEIYLTEKGQKHLKAQQIIVTPVPWTSVIDQGLVRLAQLSRGEYAVNFQ